MPHEAVPEKYRADKVLSKVSSKVATARSRLPLATVRGLANDEEHAMANSISITGNLTREPEIRYTREGQATAQLGVAVNRRWQDRTTQEWQESVSYFDVVCWRDLAENVALTLTKGMRVVVTGRLEQRSWETEEGEHRSKVEITADEVGPSLRFATADVQRNERRSPLEPSEVGVDAGANGQAGSALSVEA
jgi:single-strand DNA-binding protein